MKKVFVSSPVRGLEEYRLAARETINGLDGYCSVGMEDFGARDSDPAAFCQSKVKECDVFVCIVGHRYGSSPPDEDRSYSELEYDAAVDAKIPRLVFAAPEEASVPQNLIEQDLQRARQRLFRIRALNERSTFFFRNADHLGRGVATAFHNLRIAIDDTLRRMAPVPPVHPWTILLFPFVSNQGGLDTGIIISNVPQSILGGEDKWGYFTIEYYGACFGGVAAPGAQTCTASIGPGEQAIFVLSEGGNYGVAATPDFQGYMLAVCNFPATGVAAIFPLKDPHHVNFMTASVLSDVLPRPK